ncbi:class I SAM-dependent methyltransferase [Vibrio parahaemolyticus]|uniref:class I SAM-dependent methyltransferase n=2 Tax=Vibrio harveyi group TaxID=717610 RepID=UPI0015E03BCC|nr:class I SAM-dependent methyltransferase [Vibrio parahaemolyticus]
MIRNIIKACSAFALIVSIAWLIADFGYEPLFGAFGSTAALAACFVSEKIKKYRYQRENAQHFYGKIAEHYDERNTKFLKESHLSTVKHLKEAVQHTDEAVILDLGGGTGINVAAHFFNRPKVTWNYVDFTPEMKVAFEKNVASADFKYTATTSDLNQYLNQCNEKFDAVVISFVLTSLPYPLDMKKVINLLNDDGSLVIADIEPQYTAKHPEYAVKVNGEIHSLSVAPVNALELIEAASDVGLRLHFCQSIKKHDGERYAYVLRFKKDAT